MADSDPAETHEWLESLDSVLRTGGLRRCQELMHQLLAHARLRGVEVSTLLGSPYSNMNTPYCNTVAPSDQPAYPGDLEIERRITAIVRWNALAMVVRANKESSELGGHLASYASAADLFEVGFNHFFHGDSGSSFGRQADLVLFQPHSAPGVYARAFLEGRLTEEHLSNFRREVGGKGLSSYPHPWLMPEFWQFPTGSMGIGAITAIYQARFMRYMESRGLMRASHRRVWAFLGDGEMDEPESIGGLTLAAREKLDNLTFVINCNLQRLDGPVRGNGSIVQELERLFVGAGWNVVKLLWGSEWDDLFARDQENLILRRLNETVDGELQSYGAHDGKFNRERFFNKYPALAQLASTLSDQQLDSLSRGGHDPVKIHAAFDAAVRHSGRPTVILAQTKKGYGLGPSAEGRMAAHQQKKLNDDALQSFRDRFSLPLSDDDVAHAAFYRPPPESPEMCYLRECRKKLGGYVPMRATKAQPVEVPKCGAFAGFAFEPVNREMSSTVAFVRMLAGLLKNDAIGRRIVPIIADEARTFGMQSLFRQAGIYSHCGQLYEPEDRDDFLFYKESRDGQILEEGISEAGALSSWIAAGTSYSHHGISMLPIYIFYSMFGFQRVGDLIWAAADSRTRGFLVGATAGRSTLSGEGLQHQDGTSHLSASMVPNCRAYDPCFAYELAIIVEHGLQAMLDKQEDVFYYITTMNENYVHCAMPQGAEEGIIRGMYLLRPAEASQRALRCQVQLLGSGAILREALAAADLLERDWGIGSNVWSVTSFTELRRAGMETERRNRLRLNEESRLSWVEQCLGPTRGPVIAATDYVRALPDLIRTWVPRRYITLGTDGFGRSDTRAALRSFFEVDSLSIAFAAIAALVDEGALSRTIASEFMVRYSYAPAGCASWMDRRDIRVHSGGFDAPDNSAGALAAEK
ncbi:MAG TPA: alpha-ketoglutarate dehydrogenase [Bryobacteraceae bacterium]|nr:alpha-ketoglutarate dehydrogenase [Bryobacteraceae bacterium]